MVKGKLERGAWVALERELARAWAGPGEGAGEVPAQEITQAAMAVVTAGASLLQVKPRPAAAALSPTKRALQVKMAEGVLAAGEAKFRQACARDSLEEEQEQETPLE